MLVMSKFMLNSSAARMLSICMPALAKGLLGKHGLLISKYHWDVVGAFIAVVRQWPQTAF